MSISCKGWVQNVRNMIFLHIVAYFWFAHLDLLNTLWLKLGRSLDGRINKAPQGNERGAMGSKNPPCILELLFFSAQHGSKNPGFVLRPLSPYAIASLGVAYDVCEPRAVTKSNSARPSSGKFFRAPQESRRTDLRRLLKLL